MTTQTQETPKVETVAVAAPPNPVDVERARLQRSYAAQIAKVAVKPEELVALLATIDEEARANIKAAQLQAIAAEEADTKRYTAFETLVRDTLVPVWAEKLAKGMKPLATMPMSVSFVVRTFAQETTRKNADGTETKVVVHHVDNPVVLVNRHAKVVSRVAKPAPAAGTSGTSGGGKAIAVIIGGTRYVSATDAVRQLVGAAHVKPRNLAANIAFLKSHGHTARIA